MTKTRRLGCLKTKSGRMVFASLYKRSLAPSKLLFAKYLGVLGYKTLNCSREVLKNKQLVFAILCAP